MLSDRNYNMGNPFRKRQATVSCVSILLTLNIAFFILQMTMQWIMPTEKIIKIGNEIHNVMSDKVVDALALVSTEIRKGEYYRIFTYMFLHGNLWHILFNMWGLYMFGSLLEQKIGSRRFFILYMISGLVGAGLWLLFNWNSSVPCIGASGALFGIIVGTAMFYPELPIMLLIPPIPMKLKTFAIFYIILEIFLEFSPEGGVAHIVHLGGVLGGYIYIRLLYGKEVWDVFSIFRRKKGGSLTMTPLSSSEWNIKTTVSQRDIDRLLDKISLYGINSLTEEELDTLRRAREEMKSRGESGYPKE